MKLGFVIILSMFLAFTVIADVEKREKDLNLDAGEISNFEINCGSGYLKVTGISGLKQIEVHAVLEVNRGDADQVMAENVELSLEKRGGKAVLISRIKSKRSFFGSSRINLEIRVPKQMALDIDDGSGLIEVFNVTGNIKLEDGSGSIVMENIGGDLDIDDGSGSIQLENVGGNLKLEDGSGSIKVSKVAGNVDVEDNSGSISLFDVNGSVTVDDGSGGILIDGVEKDVYIKRAGSGGVSIKHVKGSVRK